MSILPQQSIKGYELQELIGEGAFGAVYRAHQPVIDREVAVKVILPEYASRAEFIRRFESEAQLVAQLEHIHIVPLYDYWRDPDGAYLVMRLMKGGSLETIIQEGSLPLAQVARILEQVSSALAAAHRRGIVHRDLKPANILLDEDGNAYLSDFGIAKAMDEGAGLTMTGAIVGTPAYITPEQAQSLAVSPQTDIYALGVVLYAMLAGKHPFPETSPGDLIAKHLRDPLPHLGEVDPSLPLELDAVIQRATAKEPAARYSDAAALLTDFRAAVGPELAPPPTRPLTEELLATYNPYKGLRAFQEADADDFFGREALTGQLLARLAVENNRFLAVVGPSGSGKSSVVKAGLVPALRKGALPGSDKWFIMEMVPGAHPLEELELALLRVAVEQPPSLLEQLEKDERGLIRAVRRVLPGDDDQLLLVIDQFEELFSLVEGEQKANFFLDSLYRAVTDPASRLRVVITLRADFYDRPLSYPDFGGLVQKGTEVVLPLNTEQLQDAIRIPADRVGVNFEEGLVTDIVSDVVDQPGVLPLLQYALMELFERRDGRRLTQAAYQEIGGVLGALGRRSEEVYAGLDEDGQKAARQLFLRLVTLGEGVEDTRRRVLRSEVETIDPERLPEVINSFGMARLLTFDHDPVTRGPTIEVAHEALLQEWRRLREWLEESRADIRLQRLLGYAADDWLGSNQDASFLLRGTRLDQFEAWSANTDVAFTQIETDYLEASLSERREREAAEAERLAREAAVERRSRNFLRALVGVFAVAAIVAVLLTIFAFNQQGIAQENAQQAEHNAVTAQEERTLAQESEARAVAEGIRADEERDAALAAEAEANEARLVAEEQTRLTTSRELAFAAINAIELDPELSILLALEALSVTYTQEAEEVLHRAIPASRTRLVLGAGLERLGGLAITPDGQRVITMYTPFPNEEPGVHGVTRVWDAVTGEELLTFESHNRGDGGVAISPDGNRVATVSKDDTVRVWDIDSGEELLQINVDNEFANSVAFGPDGTLLATGGDGGLVQLWDLDSGAEMLSIAAHSEWITDIEFNPDGSRLISGSNDGSAKIWDTGSGQELLAFSGDMRNEGQVGAIIGTAFSPDGALVAAVGSQGNLSVWDAESGEEILNQQVSTAGAWAVAFSPDGSQLATAGADGKAKLWDLASGDELLTLTGHDEHVRRIEFTPDGTGLVTSSYDGTARIWDITPSHELLTFTHDGATELDISPDGTLIAAGSYFGPAWIWEAESGELLHTLEGHTDYIGGVKFSPAGDLLATGSDDTTVKIWDVETGQELMTLSGHEDWVNRVAFSPDGNYLATLGQDYIVNIWDLSSGLAVTTIDIQSESTAALWAIDFSPDGAQLAIGSYNNIEFWDTDSGELLSVFEKNDVRIMAVVFSPDGTQLAFSTTNGIVKIWDLENNEELLHINAHNSHVWGMVFNSDWSKLATQGGEATIKYWDATTGELLLNLTGHTDSIFGPVFSPSGKSLVSASSDYTMRVWVLDLEELIALGEARVTRAMTTEECQQYLHVDACPVE